MSNKVNGRIPVPQMRGVPPAEAEVLLADLAHWNQEHEAGIDEDFELLALIIEEATRDVDIPQRFPTFWRKMMNDAELYEAFLDCLELLEAIRAGCLRSWPEDDAGLSA
jgi:hypothetical protein